MSIIQQNSRPLLEVAHLEALAAIERHGRLADAADALSLTPSALSHRIAEAERRLGIPLYARAHRRLNPTAAAAYLAPIAAAVLEQLARAEADSRRMTGARRRVVRLAVDSYRSYLWLPAFVRLARAEAPAVELQVCSSGAENAAAQVHAESLDLAVAPADRAVGGLADRFLFDDELVFIAPPDHPLASKPTVTGPDIDGVEFITYSRTPAPDREFARLFRPSNSYPAWVETVELPEAIVEMVAAGLGTSVLSRWAVAHAISQGRVAESRVGDEGIAIAWHAFHRPGDSEAEAVAALLARWCEQHGSLNAGSAWPVR